VVITDELVAAMPGMDEIAAVLAHELGHVQHRHSLRQLLQSSITAMAAMAIYGDVTAITGLAATAPTVLAQTGYSRAHEREADVFAFALLKKIGRSPRAFASAMKSLERAHRLSSKPARYPWQKGKSKDAPNDSADADKGNDAPSPRNRSEHATIPDYLATHPATEERIQAALDAAAN
jgi:Zn-dependent protease with chaperone function